MGEVPFTQVGHTLPEGCSVSQVSQNFTMFSLLGLCTSYVSVVIFLTLDRPVSSEQATLLLTVDCSLSVASHWWWGAISASQLKHLDIREGGTGVNTNGAGTGEGKPFTQRNRRRGVDRARGTPKVLRRFQFTFQNMNVCPYPLCQWGKV